MDTCTSPRVSRPAWKSSPASPAKPPSSVEPRFQEGCEYPIQTQGSWNASWRRSAERKPRSARGRQRHAAADRCASLAGGQGRRVGSAHRRPLRRQDAGRLRRRGDQDRAAGRRGSPPYLAQALPGHLGVVAGAVKEQAVHGAGPPTPEGAGDRPAAHPRGRCGDRELPAGDHGGLGAGLGGSLEAQFRPDHAADLRLRPDGTLPGPAGFWGDRRGDGRPSVHHRRGRPAPGARRREHRRFAGGAPRGDRYPAGPVSPEGERGEGAIHRRRSVRGGLQYDGEPLCRSTTPLA